jgi:uncharacterized protein DUF2851
VSEAFLHYLWQFQYFNKKELKTTTGEDLVIFNPGTLNGNAGPDFSQSKIKIDGIEWAGSIEIHIQSSGWMEHRHDQDEAYDNVVLHVVWEDNQAILRSDGTCIPTLQLKERVDEQLINAYLKLINHPSRIPCERSFSQIDDLIKLSMVDKVLMKRLEDKGKRIHAMLIQNNGDWEETTYKLLAGNFGFKVNKDSFVQLASSVPYKIIQKHRDQLLQIEALLFGQAGFLVAKTKDEYITRLYHEYEFLSKKYSLQVRRLNVSIWRFLRLRPSNFPTLRIAQFASLLQSRKSIFSHLLEIKNYKELQSFFEIIPSDYWKTHYRFGKKAKALVPPFGSSSADIVIINTVIPLLVTYGKAKDDWTLVERAVNILQQIPPEKNKIINLWKSLGYLSKSAFDSQGLIELYQNFCERRQCLNCVIGSAILKPETSTK